VTHSSSKFESITTDVAVEIYEATSPIFEGILQEVRELSKKKPEATMSAGKVKLVNRVLTDLLEILKDEPAGKYLQELDEEALPQMSDAVLTMVQFESALRAFRKRYYKYVTYAKEQVWITKKNVESWQGDNKSHEE
jgi:DNA polymerase III delta prime subunit